MVALLFFAVNCDVHDHEFYTMTRAATIHFLSNRYISRYKCHDTIHDTIHHNIQLTSDVMLNYFGIFNFH